MFQVSFGSTAPALSDRQEFPLFYRTVAPDSSHNPARLAFVRGLGWDTVTALSQNEDVYSLVCMTFARYELFFSRNPFAVAVSEKLSCFFFCEFRNYETAIEFLPIPDF